MLESLSVPLLLASESDLSSLDSDFAVLVLYELSLELSSDDELDDVDESLGLEMSNS